MELKKTLKDGTIETFRPHKFRDGKYRVQIKVDTLAEVERLAKDGNEVRLRGDLTNQLNLSKMV